MTIEQFWQLIKQKPKCRRQVGPARFTAWRRHSDNCGAHVRSCNSKRIAGICCRSPTGVKSGRSRPSSSPVAIMPETVFEAVRAWMILEGQEFYDRVTADPTRLSERAPRGRIRWLPDGELLLRMVPQVYRNLTGEELPTLPRKVAYVLKGNRWTDYDLPELYPDLWKKYRS